MNNLTILFLAVVGIIFLTWLVYNFYWLAQPQVYLVCQTNAAAPFSASTLAAIVAATGGKYATSAQLTTSFTQGASICRFGYALISGTTTGTFSPMNVNGVTGSIPNCGSNKTINTNPGGQAYGYWIYGTKPVSSVLTLADGSSWIVGNFIDNGSYPTDGRVVYNQFTILGVPKIL